MLFQLTLFLELIDNCEFFFAVKEIIIWILLAWQNTYLGLFHVLSQEIQVTESWKESNIFQFMIL